MYSFSALRRRLALVVGAKFQVVRGCARCLLAFEHVASAVEMAAVLHHEGDGGHIPLQAARLLQAHMVPGHHVAHDAPGNIRNKQTESAPPDTPIQI